MSISIPKKIKSKEPLSVTGYISLINELLKRVEVKIVGEVSELKKASSGHLYFSLKDEKSGDVINCAVWSSIYRMCGISLEDGMQIIVSGNADIYRARGTFTFKVQTVELVGEGALKKAYDELKTKLSNEGVFDEEKKRKIPKFPKRIGVITSAKGAAIHDFTNNLEKYGLKVYICDSRVEGQEAIKDLLFSLKIMKRKNIDVLVIARGGGSLQSLLAFDNEMLVREIANFPIPVVAGIGHHEDITLSALAADKTLSTPTAAANYLTRGYQKAQEELSRFQENIRRSYEDALYKENRRFTSLFEKITFYFRQLLEKYRKAEERAKRNLFYIKNIINVKREEISFLEHRVSGGFQLGVQQTRKRIKNISQVILANDPQKQLNLGYAIVKKEGRVVKSIKGVKLEETMRTVLSDGEIYSKIKNIKKQKHDKKRKQS